MKAAPNPTEPQEFQFKHLHNRQICENLKAIPVACSFIIADGKRGLLYVAYENKITVLKCNEKSDDEGRITLELPYLISRLSISCDYSYLAVTSNRCTAHIYNTGSLSNNSLDLIHEIQISQANQNAFAYDLRWNPAVPGMFCSVASDHSIGSFQVKIEQKATLGVVALEKIQGLDASCVAWSPKGKQLVVGCKNGNIVQLKPELKVARTIAGPAPAIGEVIAIVWISNYQFCAAYSDSNERRINVLIIDAPKGEPKASFTCYEDITFGMPDMEGEYLPRYYLEHIPEWNVIIAASSSSPSVAVLGSPDNGAKWEMWQQPDDGRAELPLIRGADMFPVGLTIDKSSAEILSWGIENKLPHAMPVLHIFGTAGQIVSFHMVNILPGAPAICSAPAEPVSLSPQPRMSLLPSEISFNMHPGVTSTPRPKESEISTKKTKDFPVVNLFNDPGKLSGPPPAGVEIEPPPKPVIQAPLPPPTQIKLKISKVRPENVEERSEIAEKRLSPVKEVTVAPPAPEKVDVDDSICWRAYQEEQMYFEEELRAKLTPQVWEVGTEAEKQKLITECMQIEEFRRELRETTSSLSSDISYVKALLLQSFAWVEETKSRNSARSTDSPRNLHDRSKIQELQRLTSYTQSQLLQAMKALDIQWIEHESKERSKIKMPSLEIIYQGLKKHSEIIAKEKATLEQIHKKWKALSSGNKIFNLNRSIAKLNISTNTSDIGSAVSRDNGVMEMRCKMIAENARKFSVQKQSKLRDILLQTQPKIIKPISPSFVQDKLEATLSSLATRSAIPAPPKPKVEKIARPRLAAVEPPKILAAPAPAPPAPTQPQSVTQSPLASLNSIVAKLGGSTAEETPPQTPPAKTTLSFSMGSFPSMFGNSTASNASGNLQLTSKPNIGNQSSLPAQSPSSQPSLPSIQPPASPAFPKVTSISFGQSDLKAPGTFTPAQPPPKNAPSTTSLSFSMGKDAPTQSTSSLFDTSTLGSALTSGMTISKIDQPPSSQNQSATIGSNSTMSFKGSLTPTTTSQSVFSFASPPTTTVAPKTVPVNIASPVAQTFSFASKPIDPPDYSTSTKDISTTLPTLSTSRASTDLSKMAMTPVSSATTEKSEISAPTTLPISFSTFNLPAGTSIEKLAPPANTSPFASKNAETTNIFGGSAPAPSIFGESFPSTFSAVSTQPSPHSPDVQTTTTTPADKPPVNSTPSIFGASVTTGFPQVPAATTAPAPSIFGTTNFSSALSNPMQTLNFGKPPTAAPVTPVAPIFGQTASSTPAPSSPFGQSAMPTNLSDAPPAASNIFGSPSNTANSSVFAALPATTTPSIFGNVPRAEGNSIFSGASTTPATPFGGFTAAATPAFGGGAAVKPAPNVFGGTAAFGSQAAVPSTPAFNAFTAKPAFGSPGFGSPSSPFAAATSTFGNSAGFGAMPAMPSGVPALNNASMNKVFGNSGGSPTFENLADQNSVPTFSSLAQKSASPEKPPSFSGGSSFSSWR